MNSSNNYARVCFPKIDAGFTRKAQKPLLQHSSMHGPVPYASSLLHSIQAAAQFPNPVLFARLFKTHRLIHILCFILWEKAIQEGCFDIYLLHILPQMCSKV
jgi:hypothetical protein